MDLPQDVLFSIFGWLDPTDFGGYSLISKSWLQMSQENELWKHLCFKKWRKNPNNSQISNNALIPVVKGSSVIDWKKAYNLRTLADAALENINTIAKNTGSLRLIGHEYFDEGWITFDQFKILFNRILLLRTVPHPLQYPKICSFLMEYELLMLLQLDSTLFSEISFVSQFLGIISYTTDTPGVAALMVAKNAIELRQVTLKRKIPIDVIGPQINLRGKFIYRAYKYIDKRHQKPLIDFLTTTILLVDDWSKSEEFTLFIAEDNTNENNPISNLFFTLEKFAWLMTIEEFMNLFHRIGGLSLTTKIYMTAATAVINHMEIWKEITIKNFFETYYPWLFGNPRNDIELLIPTFDTLTTVFAELKKTFNIEELKDPNIEPNFKAAVLEGVKFLQSFLIPILSALDINHTRLCLSVTKFMTEFCRMFDEPWFEPMLTPLLDKLYTVLTNTNLALRVRAMETIGLILAICPGSFSKHQERVVTELNNILTNGDLNEREKVVEIVCQLCAKIGDEMKVQFNPIYDSLITMFKNDKSAHEHQILMLSQWAIIALKNNFNENLALVFPVIYKYRAIEIFTTELGFYSSEYGYEPKKQLLNEKLLTKRSATLECAAGLIQHMDRELLVPYYEQIGDIIAANIDRNGARVLLPKACQYLENYVKKFFTLESTQTPVWTANVFRFIEDRLVPYAGLMHKLANLSDRENMLQKFHDIMKYLCTVNPLIHPLHNDNHMTLSLDVIISSLMKVHLEQLMYHSHVWELFQLVLDHTLNAEAFFNIFWQPVLAPQIIVAYQSSGTVHPLSLWIINEVLLRCGSSFTFTDPTSSSILSMVLHCRDIDNGVMRNVIIMWAVANHLTILGTKYPQLLPTNLDTLLRRLENYMQLLPREDCQTTLEAYLSLLYRQRQLVQGKNLNDDISELIDRATQEVILKLPDSGIIDINSISADFEKILNQL